MGLALCVVYASIWENIFDFFQTRARALHCINIYISVIPFEFSPSSQFFPYPFGIEMALLKNAVSIEESQRDVKKVHFLHAILARQDQYNIRSNQSRKRGNRARMTTRLVPQLIIK